MSDFVLDASVVVSLYLPATSVQRAYAVKTLELMRNGTVAAVPGLFDLEIGSVLIKARRKRLINTTLLDEALADLDAMFFEIHHVRYTTSEVVGIARRFMLTGYDAVYFDLAKRLNIPIASLDRGHKTACKSYGVKLISF